VITIAPGKHRMPRRRGMARAALSAGIQRPALTDPDWPLNDAGPRPQWDGPPLLHPDHPSAPVPRVRAPLVPGAGGVGRSPASGASPGLPRSRPASGPPRPPQRMPSGQPSLGPSARRPSPGAHDHGPSQYPGPPARLSARPAPRGDGRRQNVEQEAARIRQEATAIREAAQKEAAHLRAVMLSLSEQLGQMSAYIGENLASPGGLATMPTPAIAPAQMSAVAPPRPRTAPPRPRTTTANKPQARPRQYNAMRIATAATATLFSFAALTGATELGLHGFKFFVFRQTGTGETGQPDTETDQQFLAQQAAAAKGAVSKPAAARPAALKPATQKAHRPGRHSANTISGS
jgi:hypothetical protein